MGSSYEPDRLRIDVMYDWGKGDKNSVCDVCGYRYKEHQPVSGYEEIIKLCNGDLVKI